MKVAISKLPNIEQIQFSDLNKSFGAIWNWTLKLRGFNICDLRFRRYALCTMLYAFLAAGRRYAVFK